MVTKIFADGADKKKILELAANPLIRGFTTNPTLMRNAGIVDYVRFAIDLLRELQDRPISFEVFTDDIVEMERQALTISNWGDNVFVKIPITNTQGAPTATLIERLVKKEIKLNVTAICTHAQIESAVRSLRGSGHSFVSVFAGRIADTGRDPIPFIERAVSLCNAEGSLEVIWASPREVLNVYQADAVGCHAITMTPELIKKLALCNKDLGQYSLETVRMFYEDAKSAGFQIEDRVPASLVSSSVRA